MSSNSNNNVPAWDTDFITTSTSSLTSSDTLLKSSSSSGDPSVASGSSNNQYNVNAAAAASGSGAYQYVKPSIKLETYTQTGMVSAHPISKSKKIVLMLIALGLPIIIYVVAIKSFGDALTFPFFLVVFPTLIVFVPFLYYTYRKRGQRHHVTRHPVLTMMTVFSIVYTFFVPVYLASLLSPLYNRKTVDDIKTEYYHSASWLIALPIAYLHACVFVQLTLLSQCTLRSLRYRIFVGWPASVFFTTIILSLPLMTFAPLLPAAGTLIVVLIPFVLSLIGLRQTLITRPPNKWEVKNILIRKSFEDEDDQLLNRRKVQRVRHTSPDSYEVVDFKQPLTIIQIADPHIGPIMSAERLEEICESAVKLNPDLVFLTGDFFTLESFNPPGAVEKALAPLKKLKGKTFACVGNHDLEEGCMDLLRNALNTIDCCLLIDNCVVTDTRIGKVQIVGFDYRSQARQEHVQTICDAYPPIPNIPRIGLLHDPGAFKFIPADYGMLVFSGHTHGGQID
ncbi:putative metallophosphoesterase [Heterostelium album PN500]|uniref:Putative metallophosphoesterase n=1 Tax=Heterostelium pallidum (strain ATCC 26659 / Pp 5 / PN500) TaxID=670386 RepID=D3BAI8_HETP5|nr:putative metallophosphoesterase [Heterostelium album PN500]EFA81575.1 putative metallophosphoesterase [Heterostelium album PN500]|eukprot:XP_020433692.1 putative metallophosphoesterase [Heterostelium album PN500]